MADNIADKAASIMADKKADKIIRLENITIEYGGKPLLQGLNLEVKPSETVVMIGRSGCGKTTLLNILAGFETTFSGQREATANSAMVFQEPKLLPWLTVFDNCLLGVKDKFAMSERAKEFLKLVGLSGFERRYPQKLSGGEKARVAIVRALVRQPELLLLDEPFAALDAITRLQLQLLLLKLQSEFKFSMVLVTHDISEAVRLAGESAEVGRVVVLPSGRAFSGGELTEGNLMQELGL